MRPTSVCAAVAIAGSAVMFGWGWLDDPLAATPAPRELDRSPGDSRSAALAQVRLGYRVDDLDAFVAEQQRRARDGARSDDWQVLAEALLERALLRGGHRGMAVGVPTWSELPAEVAADVRDGLAAADRALELGAEDGDLHRIRAALLAQRVTGALAAMEWGAAIDAELARAAELAPNNPRLQVSLGCRDLFAPPLLGHDPAAARERLLRAAEALPDDERPLCFAGFASYLLGDGPRATELLRRAAARNPANRYVAEVLRRLESGEPRPFERDLDRRH